MQTIFVGNKPIILTSNFEKETNHKTFLLRTVNIGKVIKLLNQTDLKAVHLYDKDSENLLKRFLKLLPNTVAGGGKVFNDANEILFIYRNDKWDLPKGRAEAKESIEETAIREVEEETGVEGLKISKPLQTTYHIFKRNGKHRIKVTYWFEMTTNYSGKLKPQIKEGITKVQWLNKKESRQALEHSYANIRILI
ncbi:NUDIX hydrolase [Winogradskyella aurantiaca]|uniref:NUDIX hydrolase n=1 Tax=Winogradskyella aurantiaca TaxID=2219558 RepID=UPI000E1CD0C4|nr:NUDIX domain-containing protein [Winogradskyella aurantiaca]